MQMKHKMIVQTVFSQEPVSLGCIGRVGENIARQILFDCTDALSGRDAATIACVIRRPGDNAPYSVALEEVEDGVFGLSLTRTEVARSGKICIELRMIDGEEVLKSAIYTGNVERAITGSVLEEVGSPAEDLLDRLEAAVAKAEAAPKAYELIEMITVEEDTWAVIRTTEPSGDALSLSHLYLKLTSPAYTENRRLYFSVGNTDSPDVFTGDRIVYTHDGTAINTSGLSTEVFCARDHGIFTGYMLPPPSSTLAMVYPLNIHSQTRTGSIKAIRIFASGNTTDLIPAGTQIEIWGVRE